MLFNSYQFICIFLPLVVAGHYLLQRHRNGRLAKGWLILVSLLFYGLLRWEYVLLIATSIAANYLLALKIRQSADFVGKRRIFLGGLIFNVVFLGYFKYFNFFSGNIRVLSGLDLSFLAFALPVGISFFTIQQIAFLFDVYEDLVNDLNFVDYCLFVTFFPKLLQGPIAHYNEIVPSINRVEKRGFAKNLCLGVFLFAIGLFKKVVVADSLAEYVSRGFDQWQILSFFEAWASSLAYTLQLYNDFSGYCDMAMGIGLMLNIAIPVNFNTPYAATSIVDFWNRWHITLSRFITTYVYTPILRAFPRITFGRGLVAIFAAMLISGLWHGASWLFILWGGLHGLALVTNHLWRKGKLRMPKLLGWFLTFNFINASFVFFRAQSLEDAWKVLRGMLGLDGIILPLFMERQAGFLGQLGVAFNDVFFVTRAEGERLVATLLIFLPMAMLWRNSLQMKNSFAPNLANLALFVLLFSFSVMGLDKVSEFLYFQF